MKTIEELLQEATQKIQDVKDSSSLNDLRVLYLGKKGPVQDLMKGMKDFSKEEKEKRSKAGRAQSMFDLSYSPEITLFWQERKDAFGKEIQKIQMEYRCEATKKYGELCNITQSVGEFMNSFFQNELLEVVDDNRENYPLIAEAVDARIQGM